MGVFDISGLPEDVWGIEPGPEELPKDGRPPVKVSN